AAPILDEELLAEGSRELVGDDTGNRIRAASRRRRHYDFHGAVWIGWLGRRGWKRFGKECQNGKNKATHHRGRLPQGYSISSSRKSAPRTSSEGAPIRNDGIELA